MLKRNLLFKMSIVRNGLLGVEERIWTVGNSKLVIFPDETKIMMKESGGKET